ncbi:MAG: heme ABC exporter ATP-binding protein CcmA [Alphaproteobacteria bacterium]|nr:heme ABC exporter ATP-binding protein CcmA [Alphaproteobacteria bacterium]
MVLAAEALGCVRGERTVFRDLSFRLDAGEALVLRGPNGAGKSSLLRLVATFLKPAAGRLSWDGVEVWDDLEAYRRRLGYVGHLDAVKPLLTVAENVRFWSRLRGEAPGGDDAVEAALSAFAVGHLAEVPAALLSAGQRKRTALARLAAVPAALWLLDEPGVSLDDEGLDCLAAAVRRQRERGGMVIAATHHDLDIADATTLRLGPEAAR